MQLEFLLAGRWHITVIFEIEPVEQARPRAAHIGRRIIMYDPEKVKNFKKGLHQLAKMSYKDDPLDGQLEDQQ